jgi:hypothetical protein
MKPSPTCYQLAVVLDEQPADDCVDPVESADGDVVSAGFGERGERGDVDEGDRRVHRADLGRFPFWFCEVEERVLDQCLDEVLAIQTSKQDVGEWDEGLHAEDLLFHFFLGDPLGRQPFVDVHVDGADLRLCDPT